jgi:hypothetical protein
MDDCRFDNWTRMLGAIQDRRLALKEAVSAGVALVSLAPISDSPPQTMSWSKDVGSRATAATRTSSAAPTNAAAASAIKRSTITEGAKTPSQKGVRRVQVSRQRLEVQQGCRLLQRPLRFQGAALPLRSGERDL